MTTHRNPTSPSCTTNIDMLTPAQVCQQLGLDDAAVLDLVNSDRLAAYNLGGLIRFRMVDVVALSARLVAV